MGIFSKKKTSDKNKMSKEEIMSKLKPKVRFKAHGSFGNVIEGECVRVINSNTIEAYCRSALSNNRWEKGTFPIDRIFEIDSY